MEVVADIGRAAGNVQGSLVVVEHSLEDAPVEEVVVEAKITLRTMDPLPSSGIVAEAPLSSSNMLAMVLALPDIGAPGPSSMADAELDEELQRLLALLYQGAGEADNSAAVAMDLSFMKSIAVGVKEMQARHNQKWQVLKEQRKSANKVEQQLRDKGNELRDWHGQQF